MPTGVNDKYANIASCVVSFNGATIAFQELQTGISLGQGMGIIIDAIEYYFPAGDVDGLASGEDLKGAWSTSNQISEAKPQQKGVIDIAQIKRVDGGTAATAQWYYDPHVKMFSPPVIVAAPRIWLVAEGVSGAAGQLASRLFYRYIKLSPQEYLELAESFLLVG